MSDWFSQIQFTRPFIFLMLMLMPVFWLRWRYRSPVVVASRSLVFLFLVLALAEPVQVKVLQGAVEKELRIYAFDLSRSIPRAMRRWMEDFTRERLSPLGTDLMLVFGGDSREVKNWDAWLRGKISLDSIRPSRTNLESLISKLVKNGDTRRSLYLFTDGWETDGSVEKAVSSVSPSSLRIFPLLPAAPMGVANVIVKKVFAPKTGKGGEGVMLRVTVDNLNPEEVGGRLILKLNGQVDSIVPVRIKPGSQLITVDGVLPNSGLSSFEAQFVPQKVKTDLYLQDNRATAWVAVRRREKILILNGKTEEGRVLEGILKRFGFQVTSVAVDSSPPDPKNFKVVIFNNAARERFSPSYLLSVADYVDRGGSLVMLGGEESFGPGGYKGSPIEDALPVHLKEPVEEKTNRAVVLVIDKSGSMRRDKKLVYAKEAARALAMSLRDYDLVGVVGFDVSPFVVVPVDSLDRVRPVFDAQVERLKAGGRTFLYPAIVEARNQLEEKNASSKHVMILSDGETGGTGSDYIDLVSAMRRNFKITVSTVAIGDKANIPLLRRIAQYGGGLYHHTYDPSTLPQIVLSEIKEEPLKNPLVEEKRIPALGSASRIFQTFPHAALPPLQGYVETELKKGAKLEVKVSRGNEEIPLVASWKYGKGKTVTFATDLHGRWTKNWIGWDGLEEFWRRIFHWLIPFEDPLPPHEVRINPSSGRSILDLFLYGDTEKSSRFRYTYRGKNSQGRGYLRSIAPGHYRTGLPITAPGDYRIELVEIIGKKETSFPPVGFTLPANPRSEVPRDRFNVPLLERLAQRTGGSINPDLKERVKSTKFQRVSQSLRTFPILFAIILFLLETFVSRFVPWWGYASTP